MGLIGKVESLWRYPVKSMRGEELDEVFAGYAGVYGDRVFAFTSSLSPKGFPFFTGRDQRQMIRYRARFRNPEKAARPINLAEAESSGANPISANASELMIDVETQRPVLSHRTGGLSGSAIRPIALRCVYELSEEFEVPIMGVGGISMWDHAVEFLLAGATAVQVGTAASGKYGLFRKIVEGIGGYIRRKGFRTVAEITGLAHRGWACRTCSFTARS